MTRNSKAIPRIEFEHEMLHEGKHFTYDVVDTSMSDGDAITIAFKTPLGTTKIVHMLVEFDAKVSGHLFIYEGATWSQGSGGKVVPINCNRNSATTSTLKENETTTTFTPGGMALGVTTVLTTNATTVRTIYAFGTVVTGIEGGRSVQEVILKSDTTYVIKFVADGATNAGWVSMKWYEVLDDVA